LDDFFKRFLGDDLARGDQAMDVEMGRLGLQLFTAKGLLEAWGGRLRIAGGLSQNTVFRLSLPRA
jgi:signal transduction histidine kinase